MTYHPNDLLQAVDALTLEVREPVTRVINGTTRTERVTHPPLLVQLEEAIHGSMRSGSGASSNLPGTAIPLDSEALHKFTIISSQITDWCRIIGAGRHPHPVDGLRAWHARTLTTNEDRTFHLTILRRWAGEIRGTVNRGREKVLEAACYLEECGKDTYIDTDDFGNEVVMRWPLRFRWSGDARKGTLVCLACGARWEGDVALNAGAHATGTDR